jgi:hypothetical protein
VAPGDPLAGWRIVSPKVYELRSKWEQHLAQRALFERQRFDAGQAFNYEPQMYPYCDHFTRRSGAQPDGTPLQYVLCDQQNPDQDCPDHTTANP